MECPVCAKKFLLTEIESHVDTCLSNHTQPQPSTSGKRIFPFLKADKIETKKPRVQNKSANNVKPESEGNKNVDEEPKPSTSKFFQGLGRRTEDDSSKKSTRAKEHVPLAEKLRPVDFSDYIGQKHLVGANTILGQLLKQEEVTSMILWGPPGCGKTSLANVIAKMTKGGTSYRFIKFSATSSGVGDIRQAVETALTEAKRHRRTIIFMDEIHRFNKLQQDIFLPHVESGTFILIGATTENPSFSLNSALLSRCRVYALEKLSSADITEILTKGIDKMGGKIAQVNTECGKPKFLIEEAALDWLSEVSNGDARIALTSLELTVKSQVTTSFEVPKINVKDLRSSLEKAYSLAQKNGDRNQDLMSALHKCIRASHANAALYWLARLMAVKEDPICIARRLVRIAGEEVGLSDPDALDIAVHAMHGCQMIGLPECDVLLAQCVCYLCEASKSREVTNALRRAQNVIAAQKGPQPSVPTFIRDVSSQKKLQKIGRNLVKIADNSKSHLPENVKCRDFFDETDTHDRY